ncbi:MAG: universal stress protein [Bacteroidales bacterium]|nr:universal stress protein [Bacteroidales bacterium]MDZ4205083.1 universal stress protein [Bacteroidales bacterium]
MKTILLAIDFSDLAAQMIDNAQEMALALKANIWIVHVADPNPFFLEQNIEPPVLREQHEMEMSREQQELNAMVLYFGKYGIEAHAALLFGIPVASILEKANEIKADLIIIGKENHGFFYKALLGSTSEGVIKKAKCPVLVVPLHEED